MTFSKHCFGLLFKSLVCPNFVCELAAAVTQLSSYQLVLIYQLMYTKDDNTITPCNVILFSS